MLYSGKERDRARACRVLAYIFRTKCLPDVDLHMKAEITQICGFHWMIFPDICWGRRSIQRGSRIILVDYSPAQFIDPLEDTWVYYRK